MMSGSRIPTRVTAGVEILEESFIWEISNFDVIAKSNSMINSQSLEFEVVDTDRQSSKWKVFLKTDVVGEKRWVDIFYRVTEAPRSYDQDLFSRMHFAIKDTEGKTTWSRVLVPKSIPELKGTGGWGTGKMIHADMNPMQETLELHLRFQLYFPVKPSSRPTVSVQQPSLETAQLNFAAKARQDFGEILQNQIGGEVKIRSKDKEFTMPRGVLAARSPVFEAMLQTDMTEANDGVVTIPDIGGKALEVFLHFLYVGELLPSWKDTEVIAELTNAAAKYQLQDLLTFLDGMLGKVCGLENVATLFILAGQLSLKTAEGELLKFIREKGAGSAENLMQFMKTVNAMDNVPF